MEFIKASVKFSGVRGSGFSNFKLQITNTKQITMTEIQNPKQFAFDPMPADLDIEIWNLFAQF